MLRYGVLVYQHVQMACGCTSMCANYCKVLSTTGWDPTGGIEASDYTLLLFSVFSLNLQPFNSTLPENVMDTSTLNSLEQFSASTPLTF